MKSQSIMKKLASTLMENDLIHESRRLRPAEILTARGVIIEADHARIIAHPLTGTKILIMGLGVGNVEHVISRYQNIHSYRHSITARLPDFSRSGHYESDPMHPAEQKWNAEHGYSWRDDTGWSHPGADGHYDAHKKFVITRKFKRILTAFVDNIKSISWGD